MMPQSQARRTSGGHVSSSRRTSSDYGSRRCSSRRSSTDSCQRFHEESNNNSGSGFFALTSSFVNALEQLPLGYVDVKSNNDSFSTLGRSARWTPRRAQPRRNSESASALADSLTQGAVSISNPTWTAAERAAWVANDKALQRLLMEEVERSGVVTAAGYRAVHQNFLYSEAVEQEMRRRPSLPARPQMKRRQSRFGGLVKSKNTTSNSSMLAETEVSNSESGNNSSRNLALRRTSLVGSLTEAQLRSLQSEGERREFEEFLALTDLLDDDENDTSRSIRLSQQSDQAVSPDADIKRKKNKDKAEEDGASKSSNSEFHRKGSGDSRDSLMLQDIFDGLEGSRRLKPQDPNNDEEQDVVLGIDELVPTKKPSFDKSDALTATCTTFISRLDTLSIRDFGEVDFDPQVEADDVNINHDSQCTEDELKCGWLPWPASKQDDDDDSSCCSSNYSSAKRDGTDLLETFQANRRPSTMMRRDGSMSSLVSTPLPDVPSSPKSNLARAA